MTAQNKKLSFEIDATQIDIKPYLQKEFLELRMKAISTANPNRNDSWFTRESLERSKGTFINKPILGYFENGDFVSHNGEWERDQETNLDYWNTLGSKGERILGLIRSQDEVKIVEEPDGLSWIVFSCALWCQYNFKQVKRLLKDAKKAKSSGGPVKNISVEIDVVDYEMLDNGIMKINEFNLVGVTILGSRNGVKVEPGIEGAELTVPEIVGNNFFEQQTRELRLAYEKLDKGNTNNTVIKEEAKVFLQENNTEDNAVVVEETAAEVCPECGQDPCVCSAEPKCEEAEGEEKEDCKMEEGEEEKAEPEADHEDNCKLEEQGDDAEDKEDDKAEDDTDDVEDDAEREDEARCTECGGKMAEDEPEKEEGCDYAAKILELTDAYTSVCNECEELKKQNAEYAEKVNNLQAIVNKYEHNEFMSQATALIKSASLDDETTNDLIKRCDEKQFENLDKLKVEVALKAFDMQLAKKRSAFSAQEAAPATVGTETKPEEVKAVLTEQFEAPVATPNTNAVFANVQKKTEVTVWDKLQDYITNK